MFFYGFAGEAGSLNLHCGRKVYFAFRVYFMFLEKRLQFLEKAMKTLFCSVFGWVKNWKIDILVASMCFLLQMCALAAFGQSNLGSIGEIRYGKTLEEPFHTAIFMHQDDEGRLLFHEGAQQYAFDGTSFERNHVSPGVPVLRDSEGQTWFSNKGTLTRIGDLDTLEISGLSKYAFKPLVSEDDTVILHSPYKMRKYVVRDGAVDLLVERDLEDLATISGYKIADTLFIRTQSRSKFVVKDDYGHAITYGPILSQYDNGLIYLPDDRIVMRLHHKDTLLAAHSPYVAFIQSLRDEDIRNVTMDESGIVHVVLRSKQSKNNGLISFDPISRQRDFTPLEEKIVKRSMSLCVSSDGSRWIGTSGEGILQVYDRSVLVMNKAAGLSDDNIWSTCKDDNGNLYIATRCEGIDKIDSNGVKSSFRKEGCAWALLPDPNGGLWVANEGISLERQDRGRKNWTKSDGLISRRVFSMMRDSTGVLWFGTRTGIHNMVDGIVKAYVIPNVDLFDGVFNMVEVLPGRFLLVLESGRLFLFEDESFEEITCCDVPVTRVLKGQNGVFWLSTIGKGLFRYDAEENEFSHIPNTPSHIYQIQDDMEGMIWGILTGNRMFYANKRELLQDTSEHRIHYLTTENGLPLIAQNYDAQPSTTILDDGRLLFPNVYGAILLDPKRIRDEMPSFNFIVKNDGESIENIRLKKGENDIRLSIHGISLKPDLPYVFQYKITDEWIDIDPAKNEVWINNLSKGQHELAIRGRYTHQDWFAPRLISIDVPPLFYQRRGIQLLALTMLLGLIYGIVRWRTKRIEKKNEYLSALVTEQTKQLENEKLQLADSLLKLETSLEKQQKLTKELRISQVAKNKLYAQIAHEFKTPLQIINQYVATETKSVEQVDKERVVNNIQSLLQTSNEILDLSKAESGKLVAKKKYYNINNLIEEQLDLKQSLIEKKQLHVEFKQTNADDYLLIDIGLFQKVLANLLSNAIKFSPERGQVVVSSFQKGSQHYISVSDQGPGIPKEEVVDVVLPYFQASNNEVGGTGIGLSFVELILQLHDSKLSIDTKIGKGSTFSFYLQRPEKSQDEIIAEFAESFDLDSQLAQQVNKNKQLILVIDDNESMRHFYKTSLVEKYNVIVAGHGLHALQVLNKVQPDLIVSDVRMPIMGGLEFLGKVREKEALKAIPFFFVTGSASEELEIQSMKKGVNAVLKKPIQEAFLLTALEQAIGFKSAMEKLVKTSFSHNILPPDIQGDDLILMEKVEEAILANIENNKLKSADIAQELGLGERTLRNRVKAISGLTVKEFLKRFRLEKAKILVENNQHTRAEIAHAVGFSSLSYFSQCYHEYFNKSS